MPDLDSNNGKESASKKSAVSDKDIRKWLEAQDRKGIV